VVDIIIPTYNHCDDYLKWCIESIYAFTDLDRVKLMIVANGCTDNTREYIKDIPHIWYEKPIGFAKAINAGIKATSSEFILLLNNDTTFTQQEQNMWLDSMLEAFKEPDVGIVGSHFNWIDGFSFLVFYCVMIRRSMINQIGYLDERFGVGGAEKAGWKQHGIFQDSVSYVGNILVSDFPIYHKAEGTMHDKELIQNWDEILCENIEKFRVIVKGA
jgi:GT2 family glycosyltransferase